MRYFWSKLFAVACVACGCAVAIAAPLHDDRPVVRIGLVDTFSPEFYINTYAATVQYLKRQLPQYRFESVEFANDAAVTPQEVSKLDFLVSSAGTFGIRGRQMREALEFLNMPGVRMVLRHQRGPLASAGQDNIEFLISTNPGEEPKPLAKIASGGELSRIMLALPPMLILDEATSSIDTRTESIVQKGMDNLMKGRTVFVIAHRLSTIRNSNAIIVLDHGRIIERGDHDDLIRQKGTYYQLYTGKLELS